VSIVSYVGALALTASTARVPFIAQFSKCGLDPKNIENLVKALDQLLGEIAARRNRLNGASTYPKVKVGKTTDKIPAWIVSCLPKGLR
jgi:hypothetical protein